VSNDCDFGGFLIADGVAIFIDGHIELHGEKIYSGDIATIHLRKLSAVHTREPAVDAKPKN
jgi:hypothetical protein